MRTRLLFLLFLFVSFHYAAHAAFTVKKSNGLPAVVAGTTSTPLGVVSDKNDHQHFPNTIARLFEGDRKKPGKKHDDSGWEGIVAICCAFTFFPLAVIFGALGMKRGKKNRGLAIAGFVIGVVYTVIYALLIVSLTNGGFVFF
jgi:hypothetical protein